MKTGSRDHVNPTSDERYTPSWLFNLMGIRFDVDVCAPIGGAEWVPADRHLSIVDDGLTAPWAGRVWMNPPFSQTTPWVDRFIAHGNGVALLPHSRSKWHSRLWSSGAALADPNQADRPMFQFMVGGKPTNVYMPVVLAAFGPDCIDAISRVGRVR